MSGDNTITASDIELPDDAAISDISAKSIHDTLSAPARRGCAICFVLSAIGMLGIGLSLFCRSTPWGITSGTWYMVFGVSGKLAHEKVKLARMFADQPQLLFWAHPRCWQIPSRILRYDLHLTLHSRTGQLLEVPMSYDQMRRVVAWFKRCSPDLRIGAYDTVSEIRLPL